MRYNTYRAGKLGELCCPPYDIISEKERQGYIAHNKYNVIRLELPREGEDVYRTAAEVLDMWRDKLQADDYMISVRRNQLRVRFNVMY